jgi:protein tyrosine phosphatase (PTP) superfamily phosphohydrolase (DUF442 family)
MRELEAMGIKTVINLRAFNSDRDEIKGTSLQSEHISFKTWHPEDPDVIRFLKIITDTNRGPFVVHCQHGSDRTGTMIAIHRIALEGWSKEEAIAEMTGGGFGYHKIWKNLTRYLRELDVEALKRKAGIKSKTGEKCRLGPGRSADSSHAATADRRMGGVGADIGFPMPAALAFLAVGVLDFDLFLHPRTGDNELGDV